MYIESQSLLNKTESGWRNYSLWNEVIFNHFFSGANKNKNVYLFINDEIVKDIGKQLNIPESEAIISFTNSIKATLVNQLPFDEHYYVANKWMKRGIEESPPFIALLALFSYVAEQMVADPNFAANNYYGRLQNALDIPDLEQDNLIKSYQEITERLWPSLNEWLNSWDGQLGLPTAKALDNRKYVSVAISQALVREQDRSILKRVFSEHGLSPGQRLGKNEMLSLLFHWASTSHANNSLSRLIQRGGDFRDKVAEIACAELEAWDGYLSIKDAAERGGRLFYVATFNTYPSLKLELNLCTNLTIEKCDELTISEDSSLSGRDAFMLCKDQITLEWMNDFGVAVVEPYSQISHGDALAAKLKLIKRNSSSFFVLC
jgi:hypothetical protein